MVGMGTRVKTLAAGLMIAGTLSVPAVADAQYRYRGDYRRSVRCVDTRHVAHDGYCRYRGRGRAHYSRQDRYYDSYRPARRARYYQPRYERRYYEHRPRRSKGRSALIIAGGAATGAGVGGALRGKKGALIGAAIGGGATSIYEGARRR